MSYKPQSKIENVVFFALLAFIFSGTVIAMAIYVPSLPIIAGYFHVSKSTIAMTITGFLLGHAVSQLFYGGFSDRFGRKITLIIGTIIAIGGGVMCLLAPNYIMLLIGRVIQGAGVGVGMSMTLTIARDVYTEEALATSLTVLFTIYFAMFAIAPIAGGYIQHYLDWRWVFVILSIYFVVQFFLVIFLYRETYIKPEQFNSMLQTTKKMLHSYWRIITSRIYMGSLLSASFASSSLYAYVAITPFLFQRKLHLTPFEYGWLGIFISAAFIIANYLTRWLVLRWGLYKPNIIVLIFCFAGSIALLVFGLCGFLNLWVVMIPFGMYLIGTAMTSICCVSSALTPFGDIAGTAGSMWGALQFFVYFGLSFIYAHAGAKTQIPFGWILLALSVLVLLSLLIAFPKKVSQSTSK